MYPVLGRFGPLTLYSYGVALAVAFLAAYAWVRRECRRRGIEVTIAADLVLAAALGGLVGARLAYVIAHIGEFSRNPLDILRFNQGGLVFYGGVAGGVVAVAVIVRLRGLSVAGVADMAAPALALGAAIGRVGCLGNGCCYGRLAVGSLSLVFPEPVGGPRYATQIIDGTYNLVLFVLLAIVSQRLKTKPGLLFWMYAVLYAVLRFFVEFLRENTLLVGGLSGAQLISLGLFAAAVFVLLTRYRSPFETALAQGEARTSKRKSDS